MEFDPALLGRPEAPAAPAAPEPPKVKPTPIPLVLPPAAWADPSKHVKVVPLNFGPYAVAGRTWSEIHLRRLTTEQMAAFRENLDENVKQDPDYTARLPIYVDENGNPVPEELFGKLFEDDFIDVDQAAFTMLPRRYSAMKTENAGSSESTEASGGTSSPS